MAMELLKPENVRYIIVHCTDTLCSDIYNRDMIDRWHKDRGFDEIGYHYLIMPDGLIEVGRLEYYVGAHCLGYNKNSIGVCYVGGRDKYGSIKDTRTPMQKHSLIYIMYNILRRFPNIVAILGHNDVSIKTCPCFDAKTEYAKLISNIKPYLLS